MPFDIENFSSRSRVALRDSSFSSFIVASKHAEDFLLAIQDKLSSINPKETDSPLVHLIHLMKTEDCGDIKHALSKKTGFIKRLFSSETWSEWLEDKTALGKVIALYNDYMGSTTSLDVFMKHLDDKTLRESNIQARALLSDMRLQRRKNKRIESSFQNQNIKSILIAIDNKVFSSLLPTRVSAQGSLIKQEEEEEMFGQMCRKNPDVCLGNKRLQDIMQVPEKMILSEHKKEHLKKEQEFELEKMLGVFISYAWPMKRELIHKGFVTEEQRKGQKRQANRVQEFAKFLKRDNRINLHFDRFDNELDQRNSHATNDKQADHWIDQKIRKIDVIVIMLSFPLLYKAMNKPSKVRNERDLIWERVGDMLDMRKVVRQDKDIKVIFVEFADKDCIDNPLGHHIIKKVYGRVYEGFFRNRLKGFYDDKRDNEHKKILLDTILDQMDLGDERFLNDTNRQDTEERDKLRIENISRSLTVSNGVFNHNPHFRDEHSRLFASKDRSGSDSGDEKDERPNVQMVVVSCS